MNDVIVVRLANWLGDTVMALPALAALRAARPGARITVVGRWAPLLLGQEVADILLPYPGGLGERLRFGRPLAADRPDLAILLPNSLESALAAAWWRAKRRVGFDADGRGPLLTDAVTLPSPRRHQVDEYVALVESAGVEPGDERRPAWRLPPQAALEAEVETLFDEVGVSSASRLVGLHLGAAFGRSKLWPAESLGGLATRLAKASVSPVLLGAPPDRETALAVARCADPPPASLVGRDRPALLPWLLARLDCLVSGDTGVAHLAAALGVPTVTLFGPTDPRLTAPRGPAARVLYLAVPCSPCFLPSCPIDHVCLRSIDVEAVEAQVMTAVGA
ncbi:MAG TPA: lipopolysaccharide heptosyltransferase II [Methylomirabilota bacterium]|nr:lipopolysaccharide heptosyltransferase II [Methylomirabilota bacterium]